MQIFGQIHFCKSWRNSALKNKLSAPIESALATLSGADHLLIACDFDGTLSLITTKPEDARLIPGIQDQLTSLSNIDKTLVAIVSGRSLANLNTVCPIGEKIILIGSHGYETPIRTNQSGVLDAERSQLRVDLETWLEALLAQIPDARLEAKPYSLAVHLRAIEDSVQKLVLLNCIRQAAMLWPGVEVIEGKEVIELGVVSMNKSRAIEALRKQDGVHYKTVYIGDDTTDEVVFQQLSDDDIGIHVGRGPTQACFQIDSPMEALTVLQKINDLRQQKYVHRGS